MIAVTTSGPLFEGRINLLTAQRTALERATARGVAVARGYLRLRTKYSTPKYGHAVDSVRSSIIKVGGTADQQLGKVFIGGQAAFLAPWLEFGTIGHYITMRTRRRGGPPARALAIGRGGVFRAYAHHEGGRAFRWATLSQAQVNREAPAIFEQAYAEATR